MVVVSPISWGYGAPMATMVNYGELCYLDLHFQVEKATPIKVVRDHPSIIGHVLSFLGFL